MRFKPVLFGGICAASLAAALFSAAAKAEDCPGNPNAMGVSRTIVIDPQETPVLGGHQYHARIALEPKEFILTLDDGPARHTTEQVLEFLKKECAKATYFLIGENAKELPELVRKIAEDGHTIGTHTQTHAYLSRISIEKAQKQIDDGFRSVQAALDPIGKKVSPFFRYPGLMDTPQTEAYLRSHGIVTVGIDVLASDWFGRLQHNPEGIMERAVSRLEQRGSGILLLHDVKKVTAGLLPELFRRLKAHGFKLVHMVAKEGALPEIPPAPEPTAEEVAAAKKAAEKPVRHASRAARVHRASYRRAHRVSHRHYARRPSRVSSSAYNDFIRN
jgi:peptidoglycan/xylan/chitin deacetylase (PgdA/CDA1 family)